MSVGESIRALRKAREMTLKELADAAGYSLDYVWKVEKGKQRPSLKFLEQVATVLGADLVTHIAAETVAPKVGSMQDEPNPYGRATHCPQCGEVSIDPDDRYCTQCGFALFNFCISPERHLNPPKAKYCRVCAQRTFWGLTPEERSSMEIPEDARSRRSDEEAASLDQTMSTTGNRTRT